MFDDRRKLEICVIPSRKRSGMGIFMYKMAVVDDEPLMLEGFSKAVDWQAHGYELAGLFRNPSGLLEFCKKECPDILLLDITMPEVDGITLLKDIKKLFPGMCVIMLTAHNEFSYVRDSLRYHADEYLWKPEINFQDILECMDRLMAGKERENRTEEEAERTLYEFTDYREEENRFSYEVLKGMLQDVEYALKMEDVESLQGTWNRIEEMIAEDRPSKESLMSGILHLFYSYREYFQDEETEQEILSIFCRQNTYEEFNQEIRLIFDNYHRLLTEKKEKETMELCRRITAYMEANLADTDLNLMQVSKAIGLSYSYCSRMFPEITGKNFSRYLIDIRMDKACEYLKSSSYKISRILELVGYRDKSYFIKSFRQYTGLTPFQYREKYRSKKEGRTEEGQ